MLIRNPGIPIINNFPVLLLFVRPSSSLEFPPPLYTFSVKIPTTTAFCCCSATPTRTRTALSSSHQNKSDIVTTMNRLSGPARLMIVSDLDSTMVDHSDTENISLLRFNALWETSYRANSLLVFSTGRSPTLYKELRKEKPMLTPDITIMSVGTEITYGNSMVPDDGWVEILNHKWDRKIVTEETSKFPELKLQSETEQRPHKVSFNVTKDKAQDVMKALATRLAERGLDVKIIYSGGVDLDILPQGAGKGQALAYLLKKFKGEGKAPNNTLVCGDSGNDAELFSIPDVYGVMVSNAMEELLQWHAANAKDNPKIIHATERCAAGIIQAIGHFNLGPHISPRDMGDTDIKMESFDPAFEVVRMQLFVERWRRAEVINSELFMAHLKVVAHPTGMFYHPSGIERTLVADLVDDVRASYGDKQGKEYRVWVDQVIPTQIASDLWLVTYKKWEQYGTKKQSSCLTSAVVSSKDVSVEEGLTWVHIQQTWLDGAGPIEGEKWII